MEKTAMNTFYKADSRGTGLNWHAMRLSVMLTALLIGCGSPESNSAGTSDSTEDAISFRVDGHLKIIRGDEILAELEIEIAETDSSRERGMMQRNQLPQTRGMLFVFETEEDRTFWMANTPLSLDLLFIDADSTIMHMAKYMRPLSAQNVPSNGRARYVLEVIAGFSDTIGIIEGDRISWTRLQDD